jgi:hypothetical protein
MIGADGLLDDEPLAPELLCPHTYTFLYPQPGHHHAENPLTQNRGLKIAVV